jgi:hypothetical protein
MACLSYVFFLFNYSLDLSFTPSHILFFSSKTFCFLYLCNLTIVALLLYVV